MILRSVALGIALLLTVSVGAATHPRFLLSCEDVPRLRHACGLSEPANVAEWGRHGWAADDYRAVRSATIPALESLVSGADDDDETIPGELIAAAFMHVVAPTDAHDPKRMKLIAAALRRPIVLGDDSIELVIALDWCWSAIDPAARRDFLLNLREHNRPLRPSDSPIDHRAFRERLTLLLAAGLFDEQDETSPSWVSYRKSILDSGRTWIERALPNYLAMRGGIPSSPASAAEEECDAALMFEIAGLILGESQWERHGERAARMLEHYLFTADARFDAQFVRDDGDSAAPLPRREWAGMQPLTAHLHAARSRDGSAAWVASRVFASDGSSKGVGALGRDLWRWVPIAFPLHGIAIADVSHLPPMRNLDGAVVFRGASGELPITIWCDAGQRYLRTRQHFDAGHFLVRCGGNLIVDAAEDMVRDASTSRGGQMRLGREREAFDFEQFLSGTIAHNCMNFWEPTRAMHWRGKRYLTLGGQVPFEPPALDFSQPGSARETSRVLAAGTREDVGYVAIDLSSAYDPRDVARYRREFVFHAAGLLVIVDRVELTDRRVMPTWVLNIPAPPAIDGRALSANDRAMGSSERGGVWRPTSAESLRWSERGGNARLHPILPVERKVAIVGGPATRIATDGNASLSYVGGDADGFERIINPSSRVTPQNAWYRVGKQPRTSPMVLGEPRWGRIEIEPASAAREHVFAHAVVISADAAGDAGELVSTAGPDFQEIRWTRGGRVIAVRVIANNCGGSVIDSDGSPWTFPSVIEPSAALRCVQP